MILKVRNVALMAALALTLSGAAFAGQKSAAKHTAVGTIASMDANQVVITEKVKGKDQSMTFKLDSATQKTGTLSNGTPVTVQYRTENNENIATAVRERGTTGTATSSPKPSKKASKS
jgi:hypothetical protein